MERKICLRNNSYAATFTVYYWNASDLVLLHQLLASRNVLSITAGYGMNREDPVNFGLRGIKAMSNYAATKVAVRDHAGKFTG